MLTITFYSGNMCLATQKGVKKLQEFKKRLVKDVVTKIDKLPEDDKQYILGVMQGIMISSGNSIRGEKKKEPEMRD